MNMEHGGKEIATENPEKKLRKSLLQRHSLQHTSYMTSPMTELDIP
jgi:hypothetical protein